MLQLVLCLIVFENIRKKSGSRYERDGLGVIFAFLKIFIKLVEDLQHFRKPEGVFRKD